MSFSMEDNTPSLASCEASSSRSATALRELEERARSAVAAQRGQMERLEEDITKQIEAITAAIGEQESQEADNAQAAWQLEKQEQEAKLSTLRQELEKLRSIESDHEEQASTWAAERNALVRERDDLLKKLADVEAQRHVAQQQWQQQLADFERRLAEQQTSWNEQRAESDQNRDTVEHERDELQQKFDLALEDVQRFRGRVAELEQELARRPETKQGDSAELVALRAERDALAQRVEELESQPAPAVDADAEQQHADLQRRFEMAVEDVRELKTRNAELEAKLSSTPSRGGSTADSGAMDWESQKRRLLASLEDATESNEPLPEKERITIEDTIEMTDAVVAEKDREIERLKSELVETSRANVSSTEAQQQQQTNELLDADEVIAEHRKRIAQLEREMEDKLRTAELELSVERAKITREKAEIEELRSDLESRRHSAPAGGAAASPGSPPRRRWLSKLGITGDDQ
jgi:chromosome segregation ATPase